MTAAAKQPSLPGLSGLKPQAIHKPPRCLIHGPPGVGKSTLAADMAGGKAIIFDIEDGTENLEVIRYPFHPESGSSAHVPRSLADVISAIDRLGTEKHDFRAVVLDGLGALEQLVWRHVCGQHGQKSIEGFGYGKGYTMATEAWRELAERLDRLRSSKHMAIVFLGHSEIRTFANPEGDDFDRWQIQLHKGAAGFLRGWLDLIGFLNFETLANAEGLKGDRPRGMSTGRRVLRLTHSAVSESKSRFDLPGQIEIPADGHPWAPVSAALQAAKEKSK